MAPPPPARSPYANPESPYYTTSRQPLPAQAYPTPTQPSIQVSQPGYDTTMAGQYTQPEKLRESGYFQAVDPPGLDPVTIFLAFIAFVAVLGMVILWVFVFQAYS